MTRLNTKTELCQIVPRSIAVSRGLTMRLYGVFIFHYFPIKALPKNAKCRRSSVLDLTSRTLPRFRCRFDFDRPLHKIKHLQSLLLRHGNTKEQKQFLHLAGSSQPPSRCAARFAGVSACAYGSIVIPVFACRIGSWFRPAEVCPPIFFVMLRRLATGCT